MDPYLEEPGLWPNVHQRLITYASDALQAQIGPRYYVSIDEPVVVVVEPIERREVFIEIQDATSRHHVVTVIEVLSPSNKLPGPNRDLYLKKQTEVLSSDAHLVEVDLLRAGAPTVALPPRAASETPYRVVVTRAPDRTRRELYPARLRDRLPRVAIPLVAPDPDAVLDLQAVLSEAYEKGAYGLRADYGRDPVPPLGPDDAAWARELVKGLRA